MEDLPEEDCAEAAEGSRAPLDKLLGELCDSLVCETGVE